MKLLLSVLLLLCSTFAWARIETYFNLREGVSYVDPYRGITRPGDNLEAVILRELDAAQKSIYVAVQELRLPLIAHKLAEKHRQGVDVRIVIEHNYNFNVMANNDSLPDEDDEEGVIATSFRNLVALIDVNRDRRITRQEMRERDAIFILNEAGVPLIDDTEDGSSGSALMHHKFVVIDGKRLILSSANFTPNCVHGDFRSVHSRGNANALMTLTSPQLAELFTEEFGYLWGAQFGRRKPFREARSVVVDGKTFTVQFSPAPSKIPWEQTTNGLIGRTIESARHSVKGALFVFAEQPLSDLLQRVFRRAEVFMLVEKKFAYRFYSDVLDMLGVRLLDNRCAPNANNAPWRPAARYAGHTELEPLDFLHHKFGIVDTTKVIFGSHNWTNTANRANDEFIVVVEDDAVAREFSREYDRLSQRAQWGLPANIQERIDQMEAHCAGQLN